MKEKSNRWTVVAFFYSSACAVTVLQRRAETLRASIETGMSDVRPACVFPRDSVPYWSRPHGMQYGDIVQGPSWPKDAVVCTLNEGTHLTEGWTTTVPRYIADPHEYFRAVWTSGWKGNLCINVTLRVHRATFVQLFDPLPNEELFGEFTLTYEDGQLTRVAFMLRGVTAALYRWRGTDENPHTPYRRDMFAKLNAELIERSDTRFGLAFTIRLRINIILESDVRRMLAIARVLGFTDIAWAIDGRHARLVSFGGLFVWSEFRAARSHYPLGQQLASILGGQLVKGYRSAASKCFKLWYTSDHYRPVIVAEVPITHLRMCHVTWHAVHGQMLDMALVFAPMQLPDDILYEIVCCLPFVACQRRYRVIELFRSVGKAYREFDRRRQLMVTRSLRPPAKRRRVTAEPE